MICLCNCGCHSIDHNNLHTCYIFLESSEDSSAYSMVAMLPVSKVMINIAPVPVLTEKDIKKIYIDHTNYGTILIVQLTDRAAYDMYCLSADALGRRLVFKYDDIIVGFSVISEINNSLEFIFIPEVSDNTCQKICDFIQSRRR